MTGVPWTKVAQSAEGNGRNGAERVDAAHARDDR
jgi:hypothetical protein